MEAPPAPSGVPPGAGPDSMMTQPEAPYGIPLIVQVEMSLKGRLAGYVLLHDFMWGYARGRMADEKDTALVDVEQAAWRLVQALRACGSPEQLPYLRVASRPVRRRWLVAPGVMQEGEPDEGGGGRAEETGRGRDVRGAR